MSNELDFGYFTSGLTDLVAVIYSGASLVKASDGSLFTDSDANLPNAAIALSDTGHLFRYLATVPVGTTAGALTARVVRRAGGSLARSDMAIVLGLVSFTWTGTAVATAPDNSSITAIKLQTDKIGTNNADSPDDNTLQALATLNLDAKVSGVSGGGGGTGTGDVLVNQDTGGVDTYRVMYNSLPVDGAVIYAYSAGTYGAGATPDAQTFSGADGRWIAPMHLDAGDYKLIFSKPGTFVDQVLDLTVT